MFIKKPEDAKDLTHDIFLRVFISLSQFKGNALFSTWLYSITYNFCMTFLRKKNIVVELFDNHDTSDEVEIDDQEFLQIRARQLEWALFEISPEERMILLMKYQDDMSIKDIQETLSLGESAVKMRLKRAKSRIVTLCK
jgi:RNA polymerase sigma-70 factor (ECF subfamily)